MCTEFNKIIAIKYLDIEPSNYKRLLCYVFLFTLILLSKESNAAQPLGCIIEPERISDVGSPTIGVIESIQVERGDHVRKGQVLATLQSNIEKASVQIANSRSQAIADIRAAEEALKLARITEKRADYLVGKKFVSHQALDKAHAETAISEQKLALAKEQLRTSDKELNFARAQLNERTIRSPIDGIIADRFVWPGERVEEKPLFRVAKINPLRVEMVLSAAFYGQITKGMTLEVTPLLHNSVPVSANVVLVDQLIDGASNTFRVRAEIPNEDLTLPSGLRCKVDIPESSASNQTSSASNKTKISTKNHPLDAQLYQLKLDTQLTNNSNAARNLTNPVSTQAKQKKYQ